MADWHVTALAVASRTKIAACVDPIGERAAVLAARTGGVACSSLAEAIAVGVDAAAIIVPHNLHETLAVEALGAPSSGVPRATPGNRCGYPWVVTRGGDTWS